MTKKLAGLAMQTAAWATSVGNERGEVLTTVLTTSEAHDALEPMAAGLVARFSSAGKPPPKVLYTDRDCCCPRTGRSRLQQLFAGWPHLTVRLDAWHFMRRMAGGTTTTSHPLYGMLMSRLSACMFIWESEDVERLERAKRAELVAKGHNPTDHAVRTAVTRQELALHCRRRTAGVQATVDNIQRLLLELVDATDSLGTPLLKPEEMADIWEEQRRHVPCLQDPEDVQLYVQTGTLTKGGISLPVYRCGRGTTSLESYHLHLCRFIPGKPFPAMYIVS